jgi:hypothetical protein
MPKTKRDSRELLVWLDQEIERHGETKYAADCSGQWQAFRDGLIHVRDHLSMPAQPLTPQ